MDYALGIVVCALILLMFAITIIVRLKFIVRNLKRELREFKKYVAEIIYLNRRSNH